MLIRTVVSSLLGAGCHVVGDDGGPGLVVDPGFGVAEQVVQTVRAAGLRVAAVLITNGHVDHTWDSAEVSGVLGVPVLVHEADLPRLHDPFTTLGPLGLQLAEMAGGRGAYRTPEDLRGFAAAEDEVALDLPDGLGSLVRAMHCPGHTEGSTVYRLAGRFDADVPDGPVALTGDVLFAGSVGRTDLPGGDERAMGRTLRRLVGLEPATVVVPGHGPTSTIGDEVGRNPYLGARSPFLRD